jgi:hypothetical protein
MIVGRRNADGGVEVVLWEGAKSRASPMEADAKSCALSKGERALDGDSCLRGFEVFRGLMGSRDGDSSSRRE